MLKVIDIDDVRLRQVSLEVAKIDTEIVNLVKDMFESMYMNRGIGLAAVQVGVLKRLFVIDIPELEVQYVMINPKIVKYSEKKIEYEEGCLSIPGVNADVFRSKEIVVDYTDIEGNSKRLKAKDLLSVCIQHENDHLDGIVFIDRLEPEIKLQKIKEFRKTKIL